MKNITPLHAIVLQESHQKTDQIELKTIEKLLHLNILQLISPSEAKSSLESQKSVMKSQ